MTEKKTPNEILNEFSFEAAFIVAYRMLMNANEEQLKKLKITAEDRDLFFTRPVLLKTTTDLPGRRKNTIRKAEFDPEKSEKENATCITYNPDAIDSLFTSKIMTSAHEMRHGLEFWKNKRDVEKAEKDKKPKTNSHLILKKYITLGLSIVLKPLINALEYYEELDCFEFAEKFYPYNILDYLEEKDTKENFFQRMNRMLFVGYPSDSRRAKIEYDFQKSMEGDNDLMYPNGFMNTVIEYLETKEPANPAAVKPSIS